jgi:HTH-type transcriptional regulator, competence development regulator
MSKLGEQLRALREVKRKSVRKVAAETGLSNAYLSQLERGVARNPSPRMLAKLAEYYEAPHESLMGAAGYVKPTKTRTETPSSLEVLLRSAKLNVEEEEEVKRFVRFLKSKR